FHDPAGPGNSSRCPDLDTWTVDHRFLQFGRQAKLVVDTSNVVVTLPSRAPVSQYDQTGTLSTLRTGCLGGGRRHVLVPSDRGNLRNPRVGRVEFRFSDSDFGNCRSDHSLPFCAMVDRALLRLG